MALTSSVLVLLFLISIHFCMPFCLFFYYLCRHEYALSITNQHCISFIFPPLKISPLYFNLASGKFFGQRKKAAIFFPKPLQEWSLALLTAIKVLTFSETS